MKLPVSPSASGACASGAAITAGTDWQEASDRHGMASVCSHGGLASSGVDWHSEHSEASAGAASLIVTWEAIAGATATDSDAQPGAADPKDGAANVAAATRPMNRCRMVTDASSPEGRLCAVRDPGPSVSGNPRGQAPARSASSLYTRFGVLGHGPP